MADPFTAYKNRDGKTYDGVRLMADLSGLSTAEIRWTFDRCKHLMHVEGKTNSEAKAIVKAEAATKPWLKAT